MVDLLGDHGTDHRNVVGHLLVPREIVGDILSALPVFFELGEMPLHLESLTLKLRDRLPLRERFRHWLAVEPVELRFVIKGFKMGGTAGHAEENDAFGFRGVMRKAGKSGVFVGQTFGLKQLGKKGGRAEREAGGVEESAAVEVVGRIHRSCSILDVYGSIPGGRFREIEDRAGHRGPGR